MNRPGASMVALAILVLSGTPHAAPLGTAFTYQGQLVQGGTEVTGSCDFRFGLWDAAAGGAQQGLAIDVPNVTVQQGTFTVPLDFGGDAFSGDARWLEIAVACPPGGGLTTLVPRQELTPAPNARFAARAGTMSWSGLVEVPPSIADGDDVADDDPDPGNEIQDLGLNGNTLSLTGDATPVDLSVYLDNTDDQTLSEVLAAGNDAGGASISNLGTTTTNALTVSGLDCTANANGGALTADADGVVSCTDNAGGSGNRRTMLVSPVGDGADVSANGVALLDAVAAVAAASPPPGEFNPWVIKIEPGIYDVGATPVQMIPYVDIEGSGRRVTRVQGAINSVGDGTVNLADNAELRDLSVISAAGGMSTGFYNAIYHAPTVGNTRLLNVLAVAFGGGDATAVKFQTFNCASTCSLFLDQVAATGTLAASFSTGLNMFGSGSTTKLIVTVRDSSFTATLAPNCNAVVVGDRLTFERSVATSTFNAFVVANNARTDLGIAHSRLDGAVDDPGSLATCVGVYDGAFVALNTSCQ